MNRDNCNTQSYSYSQCRYLYVRFKVVTLGGVGERKWGEEQCMCVCVCVCVCVCGSTKLYRQHTNAISNTEFLSIGVFFSRSDLNISMTSEGYIGLLFCNTNTIKVCSHLLINRQIWSQRDVSVPPTFGHLIVCVSLKRQLFYHQNLYIVKFFFQLRWTATDF